ncbi:MAG: radical SAM protein [Desulfobulbus propionicus]|nr:MAG: radical SAM protein [Desulfobulbus propionicus]
MLTAEIGTVRKKWANRLPVALLYPNVYPVAISNLGFQLVYTQLNSFDELVCERFVYPQTGNTPMCSLESGRRLNNFPVVCCSVSFEEDFPRIAGMLAAGGIAPYADKRGDSVRPGEPLVFFGGAALIVNPEPLAPFADCIIIGEAESVLDICMVHILQQEKMRRSHILLQMASQIKGCYVPSLYRVTYGAEGRITAIAARTSDVPQRVEKVIVRQPSQAGHSHLLSPEAELGMFMVELGRGCSRGCRFCAAGYIYRPPRLWNSESIINALSTRPEQVDRIGLLGMEMASAETLDDLADYLQRHKCALSFSSLRADNISEKVLSLLAGSQLKSVAIAPDGASERLRQVINKNLEKADLLDAAIRLCKAGIFHLKLYVMLGLPTETFADLDEFADMVVSMHNALLPVGRDRGRVTEITLSVNSFVPKPWTPFQYCSFGGLSTRKAGMDKTAAQSVMALKQKIQYLRKIMAPIPNVRMKVDRPERTLMQAVFSRADRRIAPLLLDIGIGRATFRQALKKHKISSWQYAVRPRSGDELMCWDIIDHGLRPGYLWMEYEKAMAGKTTSPCQTAVCRRCGICGQEVAS